MAARSTTKTPTRRSPADSEQDAVAVLQADHQAVETLFAKFENAGARAHKTKRNLVDKMIAELSVHTAIEQAVLYPAIRREAPELEPDVLEALEEHGIVAWELSELVGLDPEDERFDAKVTVLTENVRHHVEEEERELFPAVRSALGKDRLRELGAELRDARSTAPTRPHPRTPDSPPASVVPDLVAHVVDRARERARDLIHSDQT
jgi:hemerythrin-like domain-containing protein